MKQLLIRLTDEEHRELQAVAAGQGTSMSRFTAGAAMAHARTIAARLFLPLAGDAPTQRPHAYKEAAGIVYLIDDDLRVAIESATWHKQAGQAMTNVRVAPDKVVKLALPAYVAFLVTGQRCKVRTIGGDSRDARRQNLWYLPITPSEA